MIRKYIGRFLRINWFKSLFLNLYYFGIVKGLHFPILIGYNVRVARLGSRDSVSIPSKFGVLCFGLKKEPFSYGDNSSFWYIGNGANLIIDGKCRMAKGIRMKLFDNATLRIESGFSSNANLILSVAKDVFIGEDSLLGWDIAIMDHDGGHKVIDAETSIRLNYSKPICIGKHTWIGAKSSILKGTFISENSIVGFNSCICGLKSNIPYSLITGFPATVKKTGINWEL